MAFNANAYNTRQYEVPSIANSATSLAVGTAVKMMVLPAGITSGFYFKVDAAGSTDSVFGVVSTLAAISDTTAGRVVLLNSGMIPVLMNSAGNKGDPIKVKTADGKWEVAVAGEVAEAELVESVTSGLGWAVTKRVQL